MEQLGTVMIIRTSYAIIYHRRLFVKVTFKKGIINKNKK